MIRHSLEVFLAPIERTGIVLIFPAARKRIVSNIYPGIAGIGKQLHRLIGPLLQLGELMQRGDRYCVAEYNCAKPAPADPLFPNPIHCPRDTFDGFFFVWSLDAICVFHQGLQMFRILWQFPAQQSEVPVSLSCFRRLVNICIAIVIEPGFCQRHDLHQSAFGIFPPLMDASFIADAGTQAGQADRDKVYIIVLNQFTHCLKIAYMVPGKIPWQALCLWEFFQLLYALYQPLVRIDRDIPLSRAAVHNSITGGSKVINPRKIKQNISISLRNIPTAITRASIRHNDLARYGIPQRLERLQAAFQAADLIFKDNPDREKGLFHVDLSSLLFGIHRKCARAPAYFLCISSQKQGAGRLPAPKIDVCL